MVFVFRDSVEGKRSVVPGTFARPDIHHAVILSERLPLEPRVEGPLLGARVHSQYRGSSTPAANGGPPSLRMTPATSDPVDSCYIVLCKRSWRSQVASMIQTKKVDWGKRIERAIDLTERYPGTAQVLTFYRRILEFQKTLHDGISSRPAASHGPFRERLDVDAAMRQLPALLALVQNKGPSKLAQEAAEISRGSSEQQRQMLHDFLAATDGDDAGSNAFFARVLFQPLAEYLAAAQGTRLVGFSG